MLELKGKYCKDCKIYTDNIEQDALSMIYHFLDHPMFEESKIRIMPDVHAGKDIVVGFTVPFTDHVNPDHVGGDIGCSVSTAITDLPVNEADYPAIEKAIRENVKFGMTINLRFALCHHLSGFIRAIYVFASHGKLPAHLYASSWAHNPVISISLIELRTFCGVVLLSSIKNDARLAYRLGSIGRKLTNSENGIKTGTASCPSIHEITSSVANISLIFWTIASISSSVNCSR